MLAKAKKKGRNKGSTFVTAFCTYSTRLAFCGPNLLLFHLKLRELAGDRAGHAPYDMCALSLVALLVDHAALVPQRHQIVALVWDECRERAHALAERLVDALQQRIDAPAALG